MDFVRSYVLLADGGGGVESQKLIDTVFMPFLRDVMVGSGEDAGIGAIKGENLVVSTDSYVVKPLFFTGGDIGKLSVCGSCNDVAVTGGKAQFLSAGFLIEEGFKVEDLRRVVESFALALNAAGVKLLSADTKVLPRGALDGMFINTCAIGELCYKGLSAFKIPQDCAVLVSGYIGMHGAVIYSLREGISLSSKLESDCQFLYPFLEPVFASNVRVYGVRDATRGGLGGVLCEWAAASLIGITLEEEKLPVLDEVRGVCELLGFEPYYLANEGMCVLCVHWEDAEVALRLMREAGACGAEIVGYTHKEYAGKVLLKTHLGGRRFLDAPSGELLPRIC